MSSILSNNSFDLLSVARRVNRSGIGLSANARTLNKQFLSQSNNLFNNLLSASGGVDPIETLRIQVLALQSRNQRSDVVLSSQTRGTTVDEDA